jgi:sacsin
MLANRNSDKKNQVSYDWYSPCIRSFGWLKGLPEDLYVELLCFVTGNWKGLSSHLQNAPLLKYISSSNNTDFASVSNLANHTRIYLSSEKSHISWLTK